MASEPHDLYRGEAEIIPPSRSGGPGPRPGSVWAEPGAGGAWRVHIATPGPWGTLGLVAGAGVVVACVFLIFVSAVLVAIPIVGAMIGLSLLGFLARRFMQTRA